MGCIFGIGRVLYTVRGPRDPSSRDFTLLAKNIFASLAIWGETAQHPTENRAHRWKLWFFAKVFPSADSAVLGISSCTLLHCTLIYVFLFLMRTVKKVGVATCLEVASFDFGVAVSSSFSS